MDELKAQAKRNRWRALDPHYVKTARQKGRLFTKKGHLTQRALQARLINQQVEREKPAHLAYG